MISQSDINKIFGTDVYALDGDKIGSAGQVYLDEQDGTPEWVSVRTGLFGMKESFVPLQSASLTGDRLEVPFSKGQVKDAPRIDVDGALSPGEEDELYAYYGLSSTDSRLTGGTYSGGDIDGGCTATSSRSTDDAMTRSEEHLVAGTRMEETGKARLRKYVITEDQQITVPVSHEEVRLEREPITDANRAAAYDGPDITENEYEVTLLAERPVVDVETVAVEKVRLDKKTIRAQETVSGEVRKERIEFDDETTNRRDNL